MQVSNNREDFVKKGLLVLWCDFLGGVVVSGYSSRFSSKISVKDSVSNVSQVWDTVSDGKQHKHY